MGVYQAVYSIGMFLGPLAGGLIGQQAGLGAVFITTGIFTLAAALAGRLTLRPTYHAATA
jgi:predicted MFS family arabinose efflux permease